jgi:hypothetical protein
MIAISNVFNDVSYKFADYMCINSATKNKCILEIRRHNRNSIYTTIYKHYTLAQIHANIQKAIRLENQPAQLMANNRKSIEMVTIDNNTTTHIDHIPQPADDTEIRDIFVFDNDEKCIVSIPCDKDITLFEFMHANPSYLKPFCSISTLSMIYKMYVIDNAYLNKTVQHKLPIVV